MENKASCRCAYWERLVNLMLVHPVCGLKTRRQVQKKTCRFLTWFSAAVFFSVQYHGHSWRLWDFFCLLGVWFWVLTHFPHPIVLRFGRNDGWWEKPSGWIHRGGAEWGMAPSCVPLPQCSPRCRLTGHREKVLGTARGGCMSRDSMLFEWKDYSIP